MKIQESKERLTNYNPSLRHDKISSKKLHLQKIQSCKKN